MNLRGPSMLGLALVGLTTAAAGERQFVSQAQAVRAASDNQLLCKTQTRYASRFIDKTCMTRRQWDQLRQEHQRALRDSNRPPGDQNPTMNR